MEDHKHSQKTALSKFINPEELPSFIPKQLKDLIENNIDAFPAAVGKQIGTLSDFRNKKEWAIQRAAAAKGKANAARMKEIKWYKSSKDAIEALQQACVSQSEAIEANAAAHEASFQNQQKMAEVSKTLLALGLANSALNQMIIREITLKLKNATKEELNDLARQELESVLRQLKSQEDIRERIEKQKETIEKLEGTINSVESDVSLMEQNNRNQLDTIHEEENKRINEIEKRINNLSNSLVKEKEEFIVQSKEQLLNVLSEIKKKEEELSSSLTERQESAISCLQKTIEDNITEINDKSAELARSQEAFISQSKEQSLNALSLYKNEANEKTALMKEKTDKFMKDHETRYLEMKKQVRIYKIISIIAIAGSIASVICSLLF